MGWFGINLNSVAPNGLLFMQRMGQPGILMDESRKYELKQNGNMWEVINTVQLKLRSRVDDLCIDRNGLPETALGWVDLDSPFGYFLYHHVPSHGSTRMAQIKQQIQTGMRDGGRLEPYN